MSSLLSLALACRIPYTPMDPMPPAPALDGAAADTGCPGADAGTAGTGTEADADTDTDVDADTDTDADADAGGCGTTDTGTPAVEYWPADIDLRVCADGSADFVDIQDAIDAAAPGDVIGVCPGTYGPIEIDWLDVLDIRSIEGPEVTFIDGAGGPAVDLWEGTLVLTGFHLTGDGYEDPWFPG
jgi:hypothetical protein